MPAVWERRVRHAATLLRLAPAYARLGVLKHFVPVHELARRSWQRHGVPRDPARERRVVSAVCRLSRWSRLTDRDCLQRSLLLYRELSRGSADPVLVLGFRRGGERVVGHAWVLADGQPIAERPGDLAEFDQFLMFGRRGELLREPPLGSRPAARG